MGSETAAAISPAPASFADHLLSKPGDASELAARALAEQARTGHGPGENNAAPSGSATASPAHHRPGRPGPLVPPDTPREIADRAGHGRPLAPGLAVTYGQRLGADLSVVRIHTDAPAADLAERAGARAFTVGSHVFFNEGEYSPHSAGGQALLTHELAHVAAGPPGPARLLRQPKGAVTGDTTPHRQDSIEPEWKRLEVPATGMDEAAMKLATVFKGRPGTNWVWIGLSSSFLKVYGPDGLALGPRLRFKDGPKLTFIPGVYAPQADGSLAAAEHDPVTGAKRMDVDAQGRGQSVIATRPMSKKELGAVADEEELAAKEGRAPRSMMGKIDLTTILREPEQVDALVGKVANPVLRYFVPTITSTGSGKGGGENAIVYASPIAGRGDGLTANAPPWPVTMDGPKLVPKDSSPTYTAKIDWAANGNSSFQAQVITQIGESIHYQWEFFDITKYARKQIAKDPAHTDQGTDEDRTLERNIEDFTTARRGAGTDVTGTVAARREFKREFEDWWKDNRRSAKDSRNPHGETAAERFMNNQSNLLTLQLAPVSLLVTAVGAIAHFIADLFAGPRQEQEVNLSEDGIYLIRVITTPAINEDREGKPIIRPPSVAGHIVEVVPMKRAVKEALDDPAAQLAALEADITIAVSTGNTARADYLRDLRKRAEEQYTASPATLLSRRLDDKTAELKKFKADFPKSSAYSLDRDVGQLKEQIALYEANERDRLATFGKDAAPQAMTRVNATLISEVSAQIYPLMMTAGPTGGTGNQHRWMINDITQLDTGGAYVGELRGTASEAFHSALEAFGRKAAYGRGMVGARTAGLPGMEKGAEPEFQVESAPADMALAMKRIDDLVMTLAAVGLFVASAGTAGAVIGAVVAGARLIQRWKAHQLSLNGETVGDVLGVLGGLGATGALVAGLRVERLGRAFTVLEEGGASPTQLARASEALKGAQTLMKAAEVANEAIGYAGLLWGDIAFADQMLAINAAENDPNSGMTHAAARRARADALNSAIQNNGLFLAGNMLKYRAEAKAATAATNEKAGSAKKPTIDRPAGGEKPVEKVPSEGTTAEKAPAETRPAEKAPGKDEPAPKEPAEESPDQGTEEGRKSTVETAPIEDRQPTAAELIDALPADLRRLAAVDGTLSGNAVKIEWVPDESGLVGEIRIRISPEATPRMVALHEATVRTMQKYQGFLGRVRAALARISNMLGGEALDPGNKPLFDARLEIGKLPDIINDHLKAMQSLTGNARVEAEAHLDSLQNQLEEHLGKIEIGEMTPSSGVSARGVAKKDLAKYQDLLKSLKKWEPNSDEHMELRWEMYQLDNGELLRPTWEKIYHSNMEQAKRANAIVAAEHLRLGWAEKEYVVPGLGEVRRLDLADPKSSKGAEVKAYAGETVWLSEDVKSEVTRDAKIVKLLGWEMTWIFIDCAPSGPLKSALHAAGITIERRTKSPPNSSLLERIPPPASQN